ncbi:MAG: glycosyltransferase family 2 protein [Nanoarchaeota archaeon]|nr:glycosyltransferase family 2 protein [Nanoarchaeota archaeon]
MEVLPIIYLAYMFVAIYFLSFFMTLFFRNRKFLFDSPTTKKKYSISVLVPAYNEGKTISDTIGAIFDSDYPVKEIIVLNDGSQDNTEKVVGKLMEKYSRLKILNKKNSGKADSLNQGIKIAKGDLIAVVDADSYPSKDAFGKLVGYFDDEKVGVATCSIVPKNKNNFLEKMQVIEYNVIAFTRKLLGFVDGIYVTPGPLALYRKSALIKIGGFDKENMTEDIEATWHLVKEGYRREMNLSGKVTTTVPNKYKAWFNQRRRWSMGGLQCILKYKKNFFKKGMLGMFILPFFVLQLSLGVVGMGIFIYLMTRRILDKYIFITYSLNLKSPLVTSSALHITPSVLNYLGIVLFIIGGLFTILALYIMKESILNKQNIFKILFYFILYLPVYPFISINAIYHYIKGTRKWR